MPSFLRRQFLKSGFASMAAVTTASSLGLHLSLSSRLMAQTSTRFSDYKALVCIYLYGGCDSYNLLVPTSQNDYNSYQNVRQNLAYSKEQLLHLNPQNDIPYALGMPGPASSLQALFNQQKMSIVANVGPMRQPLSKAMVLSNPELLPPQLFSHNDQQSLWQSAMMNTSSNTGWGGRMADLIGDTNDSLSMNLSINGNNLLQSGSIIQPFAVDASGPERMSALNAEQNWNSRRIETFNKLMQDAQHPLERAYANKLLSANENNSRLIQALSTTSAPSTAYPADNDLADQLKMVAQLIASQTQIGQPRQIYFVGMGGWDTHDNQSNLHPQLLANLGDAMLAFQEDLEARQVDQGVSTFTMSEFGRTLTSNGDGTDHGWGGHQLIMGNAIKGGHIFGSMPSLMLNSDDDMGDGRMVPSLAVDQFAGDLSRWFGLGDAELSEVFPNIGRFDNSTLRMFES